MHVAASPIKVSYEDSQPMNLGPALEDDAFQENYKDGAFCPFYEIVLGAVSLVVVFFSAPMLALARTTGGIR